VSGVRLWCKTDGGWCQRRPDTRNAPGRGCGARIESDWLARCPTTVSAKFSRCKSSEGRQTSNGLAITGLVTGIVGAALSLIPFAGVFLCWLPALLEIIFGLIAIGTAKCTGLRHRESLAAVILGFVPIPVIILYFLIGLGAAASSASYSS